MTAFAYKAANREGKIVEGQIEAETERAVLTKLQDLGYLPLRITAGSNGALDPADYDRTVATLMAGGSDPVITKKPEGAWTSVVTDKAKTLQ